MFYCDVNNDIWKYIRHILRLYAVWTIIYFPLTYILSHGDMNWISYIKECVYKGSFSHLWYLPSIAVAMLVVYLISKKVDDRIVMCISFLLYFIGAFADTYSWLIYGTVLEGSIRSILNVFMTTRNGVFFLPIYVAMGKCIAKYKKKHMNQSSVTGYLLFFSMVLFLLEGILMAKKQSIDTNYYFTLLFLVPLLLLMLLYRDKSGNRISDETSIFLRKESSIIYYMHYLALYCCNFVFHIIGVDYERYHSIEFISAVCSSLIIGWILISVDKHTRIKFLRILI